MNKISSKKFLTKKGIQISFLIICSLFIVDCAWGAPRQWKREYIKVFKIIKDNTILIKFKFLDYTFGPANTIGYLQSCEFYYSIDDTKYNKFMSSETSSQKKKGCSSWLNMMNKLPGARLYFIDCSYPVNGSIWLDSVTNQRVETNHPGAEAYASIKWLLTQPFQKVCQIKVVGLWRVGIDELHLFTQYYSIPAI